MNPQKILKNLSFKYRVAVEMNILGTKKVISLSKKMKNLEVNLRVL